MKELQYKTLYLLLLICITLSFKVSKSSLNIKKNMIRSKSLIIRATESRNDLITTTVTESELNSLISKMPTNEKYSLLLQSYSRKVLDNSKKG